MSWYKKNIEPEIRNLVKLLRKNGFNTTCSCGHDMHIECQYIAEGEIKRLHDLMFNNGYRNYRISIEVSVVDGHFHADFHLMDDSGQK